MTNTKSNIAHNSNAIKLQGFVDATLSDTKSNGYRIVLEDGKVYDNNGNIIMELYTGDMITSSPSVRGKPDTYNQLHIIRA